MIDLSVYGERVVVHDIQIAVRKLHLCYRHGDINKMTK